MITGIVGQAGWMGMQRGMEGLRENAAEIASVKQLEGTAERDISAPLIEQTTNLRQVEASAKVVQADNDMNNYLLDLFA